MKFVIFHLITLMFIINCSKTTAESLPKYIESSLQNDSFSGIPPSLMDFLAVNSGSSHVIVAEGDRGPLWLPYEDESSRLTVSKVSCDADAILSTLAVLLHTFLEHTVMVACDKRKIIHLFQKVMTESLESRRIKYILLGVEGEDLHSVLREGSRIVTVNADRDGGYEIRRADVSQDSSIRFKLLFHWPEVTEGNRTVELFPSLLEKYQSFKGRHLTIVGNNGGVFTVMDRDENGTAIPIEGIDLEIMNILAETLDFTYSMVFPPDGLWGNIKADGSVSGMIGTVYRREADVAVDIISITSTRASVVDFSIPYAFESVGIISRKPGLKIETFTIFKPFQLYVWLLFVGIVILIGPIAKLFGWTALAIKYGTETSKSERKIEPTGEFSFNLFKSTLSQDNSLSVSTLTIGVLFTFWYLVGMIMNSAYGGSLTAVFAAPSYEKPINTLRDVINTAKKKGMDIILRKDTSLDALLKQSENGTYKELGDLLDNERSYGPALERYAKIKEGIGIGFATPLGIYPWAVPNGFHNYYIGKEKFYFQPYAYPLPKGAPYKPIFDKYLHLLIDSGIIGYLTKQTLMKLYGVTFMQQVKHPIVTKPKATALSLTQLQGAFVIWLIGIATAVLCMMAEMRSCNARNKMENKVLLESHSSKLHHSA